MLVNIAKQPERLSMVVFDGDNDQEVNDYILSVADPTGTAEVLRDENNQPYIKTSAGYPDKPLTAGAFVHAMPYMWGGPIMTVYSPAEANAQLYAYPTFDPVAQQGEPQ